MRKLLFILIFFLSTTFCIYAKNWEFSISPYTALTTGKLGEYLYSQYNKNSITSDLQWNETLWSVGIKADYRYKHFFTSADFTYHFPFICGKMTDSDYNSDFKTNYVEFDNNAPLSIQAQLDLGWRFDIGIFSISPVLKGIYSYQKFEGKNGKGWLGDGDYIAGGTDVPWNDSRAEYHEFFDINYSRLSLYTFIGTKLQWHLQKFELFGGLYISPFTYADDVDYHDGRTSDAYTSICITTTYFTRMYLDTGFTYAFTDNLKFLTELSFLFGGISKGAHVTNYGHPKGYGIFKTDSEYYRSSQDKGMDVYIFDVKVGIRYCFGK